MSVSTPPTPTDLVQIIAQYTQPKQRIRFSTYDDIEVGYNRQILIIKFRGKINKISEYTIYTNKSIINHVINSIRNCVSGQNTINTAIQIINTKTNDCSILYYSHSHLIINDYGCNDDHGEFILYFKGGDLHFTETEIELNNNERVELLQILTAIREKID